MSSPPRKSRVSSTSSVFIPKRYENIGGYKCISVLPEDDSTFYRMDKEELASNPSIKASDIFGIDRNTYFGVENQELQRQYKYHPYLYTIKINTPIVLIDMGNKENVEKLMLDARDEIKQSINIAFPIKNGILTRFSQGASNHNDGKDHDRIVLQHICSLPNIDGYYVNIIGHHPEIGFCAKSLHKLNVIGRQPAKNPPSLKRTWHSSNYNPSKRSAISPDSPSSPKISRSRLFFINTNENNQNEKGPSLELANLQGGKRKTRRNRKPRKTQKKQSNRK